MANFDKAFWQTMKWEGGYVNDLADSGGETKYGISKRAYPNVDIASLTEDGAKRIYYRDYWVPITGSLIDSQDVAMAIFDAAVNHGVSRAVKMAQEVVCVEMDGILGPNTRRAINSTVPMLFVCSYTNKRIAFYERICSKDRSQLRFLLGWIRRALSFAKRG